MIVPDLDGELMAVLRQMEELRLELRSTATPSWTSPHLPPLAAGYALDAVERFVIDLQPARHPDDGSDLVGRWDPAAHREHTPMHRVNGPCSGRNVSAGACPGRRH